MDSEEAFQAAVKRGLFAGLSLERVYSITLPWPDKTLSPNARVHWSKKAKAVKAARGIAHWTLHLEMKAQPLWQRAGVSFTFCPPDRRRRDRDNLISSMKAATDGIADALGIDDSKFVCSYAMGEPVKGGAVRVEIKPIQP